jgi:hypothetical protein
MRTGAIADGRILYNVALGEGPAVLDTYPGNGDLALTDNNDILLIGRKLGLDGGVDLDFGPDQEVVYLQFGRAWSRKMH